MATKDTQNGNGIGWASELAQKYTAGISHMFVLHFNVADYAAGEISVEEYLQAMLDKRDLVITYSVAEGIEFASPDQRKLFIKALGLDRQQVSNLAVEMGLAVESPASQQDVALPRQPAEALPLLEQALHLQQIHDNGSIIYPRVAVIIKWPELLAPATSVAMMQPCDRVAMATLAGWATDQTIMANQAIVVLVTRSLADLAEPLRASTARIEAIAVPLPDEPARLTWIKNYLARKQGERAKEIESQAWDAVRAAMAISVNDVDFYWEGGRRNDETLWDNTLDSAPTVELRKEAERLLKKARKQAGRAVAELRLDIPIEILARMTAGLSLVHVEDIFLRSLHENRPVDRELVKDRKNEIIRQEFGDVLEIMDPRWGLDMIAGHQLVKQYFRDYVIEALHKGDVARAPQGVLLVGPPGTGKTAIVEAVAFEAGFNAINLNLARILGGLVGASERNLEKALLAIEALTPVVVFTDEIDQKFGRRSEGFQGDSGVSARLFSRVMEFMSDTSHRGKVVWLAASNRPDLLDAAFKRPGRFDMVIPLLLPEDDNDRLELFDVMLRKYGLTCEDTAEAEKMLQAAHKAEGYTGAELEAVIIKANQVAGRHGRAAGSIHPDDILEALNYIRSSTEGIEFMTFLALQAVTDLEFVPERYRKQAADRNSLKSAIESHTPKSRSAREL